jgi:hypothetical protein
MSWRRNDVQPETARRRLQGLADPANFPIPEITGFHFCGLWRKKIATQRQKSLGIQEAGITIRDCFVDG